MADMNITPHSSLGYLRGRNLVGEQPENMMEFSDDSDSGEIVQRHPLVVAAAAATAISETNRKKEGEGMDIEHSNGSVEEISHNRSTFDMNSVVNSVQFDFGGESSSNRRNVDDDLNDDDDDDDEEGGGSGSSSSGGGGVEEEAEEESDEDGTGIIGCSASDSEENEDCQISQRNPSPFELVVGSVGEEQTKQPHQASEKLLSSNELGVPSVSPNNRSREDVVLSSASSDRAELLRNQIRHEKAVRDSETNEVIACCLNQAFVLSKPTKPTENNLVGGVTGVGNTSEEAHFSPEGVDCTGYKAATPDNIHQSSISHLSESKSPNATENVLHPGGIQTDLPGTSRRRGSIPVQTSGGDERFKSQVGAGEPRWGNGDRRQHEDQEHGGGRKGPHEKSTQRTNEKFPRRANLRRASDCAECTSPTTISESEETGAQRYFNEGHGECEGKDDEENSHPGSDRVECPLGHADGGDASAADGRRQEKTFGVALGGSVETTTRSSQHADDSGSAKLCGQLGSSKRVRFERDRGSRLEGHTLQGFEGEQRPGPSHDISERGGSRGPGPVSSRNWQNCFVDSSGCQTLYDGDGLSATQSQCKLQDGYGGDSASSKVQQEESTGSGIEYGPPGSFEAAVAAASRWFYEPHDPDTDTLGFAVQHRHAATPVPPIGLVDRELSTGKGYERKIPGAHRLGDRSVDGDPYEENEGYECLGKAQDEKKTEREAKDDLKGQCNIGIVASRTKHSPNTLGAASGDKAKRNPSQRNPAGISYSTSEMHEFEQKHQSNGYDEPSGRKSNGTDRERSTTTRRGSQTPLGFREKSHRRNVGGRTGSGNSAPKPCCSGLPHVNVRDRGGGGGGGKGSAAAKERGTKSASHLLSEHRVGRGGEVSIQAVQNRDSRRASNAGGECRVRLEQQQQQQQQQQLSNRRGGGGGGGGRGRDGDIKGLAESKPSGRRDSNERRTTSDNRPASSLSYDRSYSNNRRRRSNTKEEKGTATTINLLDGDSSIHSRGSERIRFGRGWSILSGSQQQRHCIDGNGRKNCGIEKTEDEFTRPPIVATRESNTRTSGKDSFLRKEKEGRSGLLNTLHVAAEGTKVNESHLELVNCVTNTMDSPASHYTPSGTTTSTSTTGNQPQTPPPSPSKHVVQVQEDDDDEEIEDYEITRIIAMAKAGSESVVNDEAEVEQQKAEEEEEEEAEEAELEAEEAVEEEEEEDPQSVSPSSDFRLGGHEDYPLDDDDEQQPAASPTHSSSSASSSYSAAARPTQKSSAETLYGTKEAAMKFFKVQREQALQKLTDAEDISCKFLLNSIKSMRCHDNVCEIINPYIEYRAREKKQKTSPAGGSGSESSLIPVDVLERVQHLIMIEDFYNIAEEIPKGISTSSLSVSQIEELQTKQITNSFLFSKLNSLSSYYYSGGSLSEVDAQSHFKRIRKLAKQHTDHFNVMCIQISALRLLYDIKIAPLENQLNLSSLILELLKDDVPPGLTMDYQQQPQTSSTTIRKKRKSQSSSAGGAAPSRSFYNNNRTPQYHHPHEMGLQSKYVQKSHLKWLKGACINLFSGMFNKDIGEITMISQRISGLMLKFGIPLHFVSWSEHYRKSEAYVEDLHKSVNNLRHLSSCVSLDIIKQARTNYESWCLKCYQLETSDMEKEELDKMILNAKSMQAEQRDYIHASNSASIFTTEVWSIMQNILDQKNTVMKTNQDTVCSMLKLVQSWQESQQQQQNSSNAAATTITITTTSNSKRSRSPLPSSGWSAADSDIESNNDMSAPRRFYSRLQRKRKTPPPSSSLPEKHKRIEMQQEGVIVSHYDEDKIEEEEEEPPAVNNLLLSTPA